MRRNWTLAARVLWDAAVETGTAAAAAAAAPPAAAAAPTPLAAAAADALKPSAAAVPAVPAAAAAAEPAKYAIPETIPEVLRGKDERETLDKIAKDYADRPKIPDKPDGYELKLEPKFSERFGDMKDDPVLPLYRDVAHKHGLTPQQFNGVMQDMHAKMAEAGILDDPVNVAKELAKLEPTTGDMKQRSAAAAERVQGAVDFVSGLRTRGYIDADGAQELAKVAVNAAGVKAIESLMKLAQERGIQVGGDSGAATATPEAKQQAVLHQFYPSMTKAQ